MSSSKNERTIPGPSSTASIAISADHFSQLMISITASQSGVDTKLQQFGDEICQGKEEAATKAVKWTCCEKLDTFCKRRNEEQATFIAKVEEALSQAESDLSSIPITSTTSSAIQRVSETLCKLRIVSSRA